MLLSFFLYVDFHTLLVALTRVGSFDDMRFLVHGNQDCSQALEHLCELKPDDTVMQVLAGWEGNNTKWNQDKALKEKERMDCERREKQQRLNQERSKRYGCRKRKAGAVFDD